MRLVKLVVLFITLSFAPAYSQMTYMEADSAFMISFKAAEKIKYKIENQKKQIDILIRIGGNQDLIIKKLQLRDSLHALELIEYQKMDSILREKINNYDKVTSNYRTLLISTEEKLRFTEAEKKNETYWKDVYKYGYPILGAVIGIILLTR
jgi:hypothetical protein